MALSDKLFQLLGITNSGWVPLDPFTAPGAGNDDIILNGLINPLTVNAGDGNDRIILNGAIGVATIVNAGNGSDQIYGGGATGLSVEETLNGGNGDDYIEGRGGAIDILNGGAGSNTLGYESSNAGVTIDMRKSTNILTPNQIAVASGGHATGDQVAFNTFDNVVGSAFADNIMGDADSNILIGLAGNDTLNGFDGNDTLIGGAGADTLNGGNGVDTASYLTSTAGVTIDLNSRVASGGEASGDVLSNIENVVGSDFADIRNRCSVPTSFASNL